MPGTTVTSSSSRTAKRTRPSRPSISRPKYQKMASVMTVQRSGSLASGQVNDPPHLAVAHLVGVEARGWPTSVLVDRPDEHAGDAQQDTSTVVLTSSVPIRNHGSPALRRSGTENEKRPAMGLNRILDTDGQASHRPARSRTPRARTSSRTPRAG